MGKTQQKRGALASNVERTQQERSKGRQSVVKA